MRMCDICGIRPATVEVRVVEGGERKILHLCERDYARLSGGGWFFALGVAF